MSIFLNVLIGIVLLLSATVVFDVMHVLLHVFARSHYRLLRALGSLHETHHYFLDAGLQIHEELIKANLYRHVIPEFVIQVLVTLCFASFFPMAPVIVALGLELVVFIFIIWGKPGIDVNHHSVDQLKAYRPLYFCVPEYHLLHHIYPTAYFSSWIKTLDHLLCTGIALQNRRIGVTGNDAFSKILSAQLEQYGAVVQEISSDRASDNLSSMLCRIDILVLCHQPQNEHGYSYHELTEKFYLLNQQRKIPVEVWALDSSDIDERKHARQWFTAEKVIYRLMVVDGHIIDTHSITILLRGIRRGYNFVPAIYNVGTLQRYLQFVLK